MVDPAQETAPDRVFGLDPEGNPIIKHDDLRWRGLCRPHPWRPPTDAYESDEGLVVRVEVAGMKEADFSITLQDQFLRVRGVRPDTSERKAYHQLEIQFGEFSTEVELPFQVVVEQIEAVYRDGFLRIMLPRARPHQVQIDS